MDAIVSLVLGGVMLILSLLMPVLAPALGIWIALFGFEKLVKVVPLFGGPLSAFAHFLRHHYEALLKWCWKLIAKYVGKFFRAVGRGLLKVVKRLLPAAWRGLVRIKDNVRARIGSSPTPPPASPPAP